ncbi:MAG: response regulator [Candidatus Staskawiczbacteria bacterium]|jgi:two-component system OmpR family response regulator
MADAKKKVLIVEDSKSYLFIITESLRDAGLVVVTAGDGQEGLEVVASDKPDLILLDITMPKMDGITMSKKLKEAGVNVPIIFLTNMSDIKHMSDALESTPDKTDYIVKADTSSDDIVARVKDKLHLK